MQTHQTAGRGGDGEAPEMEASRAAEIFPLDQVLYHFDTMHEIPEPLTIRQACEGVQIFGGIGSGKTSGSGAHLAKAYLRAGFGGLVLCAKKDAAEDWQQYAEEAGRSDSVLLFDHSGDLRFNFLQYEAERPGAGAGFTNNILRLFLTVHEVLNRGGGGGDEAYWRNAMEQLIRNAIELCLLSGAGVSIPELYKVVMSAPQSPEQEPEFWHGEKIGRFAELIQQGDQNTALDEWEVQDFITTSSYWLKDFATLGQKQRAGIVSMFTSIADSLMRRPFSMLFNSDNHGGKAGGYHTAWPELTFQFREDEKGRLAPPHILILNLPVKEFGAAGRAAQVVYKYLWQQAIERRDVKRHPTPAFLWMDEAQNFVSEWDMQFMATSRSVRACPVFLTQNLPNYIAEMGGQESKARVDSLVGNFATKIWHANSDPQTNQQAADVIGKSWQVKAGMSSGYSGAGYQKGESYTQQYGYDAEPKAFTVLLKGGPENGFEVGAVVFQNGRLWQNESTVMLATFNQLEG